MAIDKKTKLMKAIKVANFMRDRQGKLKRTNDWSGISAAVRTMIDGGQVRLDFPSDDYLKANEDDTDTN
jgi:hypothetical protein